jgi:protein-disulfide isomerase
MERYRAFPVVIGPVVAAKYESLADVLTAEVASATAAYSEAVTGTKLPAEAELYADKLVVKAPAIASVILNPVKFNVNVGIFLFFNYHCLAVVERP